MIELLVTLHLARPREKERGIIIERSETRRIRTVRVIQLAPQKFLSPELINGAKGSEAAIIM